MPGQRAKVRRAPGRAVRGPVGRARLRLVPGALLVAAMTLPAAAPPALAGPADLPPWDPAGRTSSPAAPPAGGTAPPAGGTATPTPAAPVVTSEAPSARVLSTPSTLEVTSATEVAPVPAPPTDPITRADLSDELPPPPTDPNDAPFMRAPNNQIQPVPPRTRPDLRRGWSARRRFAATLAPAFASLRLEFQGPRPRRNHGAGIDLELDAQIWRWIWLRVQGTYSGHPVDEVRVEQPDKSVKITAPAGTIHVAGFGGGPVFALDLGRFLPLIEIGVGGLRVATPAGGGVPGLRGEQCRGDGSCDAGLRCSAARVCEPTIMPELYFGGAVDLLVRRHLSFGAQFRYYARLTSPGNFPLYLLGTLRVSVRF